MEKFLPIGIQNFERMITGNFYYVDKTRYIYEMVRPSQGFYFLARPRRFGKSLTVSTLDYLFQGRKDLFDNLYIAGVDWEWKQHPVVKIDFNAINFTSSESLNESLLFYLHRIGSEHGIDNAVESLPEAFSLTIIGLFRKYQERVAVLIDEYDKPIIDHLGRGEDHLKTGKENRDRLKQFFGVLKSGEVSAVLRLVFITGISKFARVSIFSDLNNLDDISMQEPYDAFLGYTHEELESCFRDPITRLIARMKTSAETIQKDMQNWYDGYRFTESETQVYNPFSIVNFLKTGKFANYWFETATPTFLLNLIRENAYPVADIENMELPKELITVYDLDYLSLEPLLFQTGYITIKGYADEMYRMGYPNQEVKTSFLSYLLNDFVRIQNLRVMGAYKRLYRLLNEKNADEFIRVVKSIFASIPYTQIANQGEVYYHTVFYLMLSASGVDVDTEVLSNAGRLDMKAEFSDKIYIIELKCDQGPDKAIEQILEKRYYEKYLHSGKGIPTTTLINIDLSHNQIHQQVIAR
jgi:hypothetical protein